MSECVKTVFQAKYVVNLTMFTMLGFVIAGCIVSFGQSDTIGMHQSTWEGAGCGTDCTYQYTWTFHTDGFTEHIDRSYNDGDTVQSHYTDHHSYDDQAGVCNTWNSDICAMCANSATGLVGAMVVAFICLAVVIFLALFRAMGRLYVLKCMSNVALMRMEVALAFIGAGMVFIGMLSWSDCYEETIEVMDDNYNAETVMTDYGYMVACFIFICIGILCEVYFLFSARSRVCCGAATGGKDVEFDGASV